MTATQLSDHYDTRAAAYDDSWHPSFARNINELVKPQLGDLVLDLACGTGLVSLLAATSVGSHGRVIGVDFSEGMLDQARAKAREADIQNVEFYQHSITDLHTLEAIKNKKFDIITCISALVLFPEPGELVQKWVQQYLKPGGRFVTDVTHSRSQIAHVTMERVGRDLGVILPFHRLNFEQNDSLGLLLVSAGLIVEEYRLMSQLKGRNTSEQIDAHTWLSPDPCISATYKADEADTIFDETLRLEIWQNIFQHRDKSPASDLFKQHWELLADRSGKIEEVDGVFVAIGRRKH